MSLRWLFILCLVSFQTNAFAEQDDLVRDIGWLQVFFSAEDVYDSSQSKIIGEVVGPLVKAKIKTRTMRWYKPVYGDQNLLYFPASYVFADKQMRKLRTKVKQAAAHWEMKFGTREIKEVMFRYVESHNKNSSYVKHIYACGGSSAHVVYYWGSENPRQLPALQEFLRRVANKCQ